MKKSRPRRFAAALTVALCAGAHADDDHNHGNKNPTPAASASPRVHAHSDLFELVGVVDKGQMTVYLDRFATNEPVTAARLEFEAGAHKGVAQPQADGTYQIRFDALSKPGELPFAFTVAAGADADVLTGHLELTDLHDHHAEAANPWLRWAAYAAAAFALLAAAAALVRKARPARLTTGDAL